MNAIVSFLRRPPANDNGGPAVIPVFTALLARHDLSWLDVIMYGLVAECSSRGVSPSRKQIGAMVGVRKPDAVRARLQKLEEAGLLRRVRRYGRSNEYEILGPTCSAA